MRLDSNIYWKFLYLFDSAFLFTEAKWIKFSIIMIEILTKLITKLIIIILIQKHVGPLHS